MTSSRPQWPPTRQEIAAYGSFALLAAGLIICGVGLAEMNLGFVLVGVVTMAAPLVNWVRIRYRPGDGLDFEGEMEKPPDSANASQQEDESSRRHSA